MSESRTTVHFVFPELDAFAELVAHPTKEAVAAAYARFSCCNACWVMLTYLQLAMRGFPVSIGRTLATGRINVVSIHDLRIRAMPYTSYVVACRHDGPPPAICEHVIVQNPLQPRRPEEHLVPHWPQPGLVPRDPRRGARVENVTFKGWVGNLYGGLASDAFRARLAELGLAFRVVDDPRGWNDYRDDDVCLALRDLTEADYATKPASKLVNAWLAGVPALLGPEPAYRALRRGELDYFEVRGPNDAIDVLLSLASDPALYAAVVANGRRRATEVDEDAVARRWADVLFGPVAEGHRRWLAESATPRRYVRPLRFARRVVEHKLGHRRYLHDRDHGYRPTSGTWT